MMLGMSSSADIRAPHGLSPSWISPELMAETRAVWQPYYEKELTEQDLLALLLPVGVLYELVFSKGATNEEAEEINDNGEDVPRLGARE
jgi:hypothetical protein